MEGTRPLRGLPYPTLLMRSVCESQSQHQLVYLGESQNQRVYLGVSQCGFDFDVDFNILTAFIRLGRARPAGAGCPPYYYLTFYYFLTLLSALYPPNPRPLFAGKEINYNRQHYAQQHRRGDRDVDPEAPAADTEVAGETAKRYLVGEHEEQADDDYHRTRDYQKPAGVSPIHIFFLSKLTLTLK
jgi:hypothetical protein